MTPEIHWGEPEELKRLHEVLGEQKFNEIYEEYAVRATVATICGHRIVPLYDRNGEASSFHVMHTVHTFGTLSEATSYAMSLPN